MPKKKRKKKAAKKPTKGARARRAAPASARPKARVAPKRTKKQKSIRRARKRPARPTKTPTRKVAARRRSLRIKKRRGPLQLGLPLQMPFAFGPEAYAERPVLPSADGKDAPKPARSAPEGEQTALFS